MRVAGTRGARALPRAESTAQSGPRLVATVGSYRWQRARQGLIPTLGFLLQSFATASRAMCSAPKPCVRASGDAFGHGKAQRMRAPRPGLGAPGRWPRQARCLGILHRSAGSRWALERLSVPSGRGPSPEMCGRLPSAVHPHSIHRQAQAEGAARLSRRLRRAAACRRRVRGGPRRRRRPPRADAPIHWRLGRGRLVRLRGRGAVCSPTWAQGSDWVFALSALKV